jgi:predicted transcriptional regulator
MDAHFTDRELDVMRVLWTRGPSIVAEVRAALEDRLAYTTVLTILRTLESKGFVSHEEEGRGHRFFATVQQQAAQTTALRHLTRKLFEGSAELLLTQLVSDQALTPAALDRMRALLAATPPERKAEGDE